MVIVQTVIFSWYLQTFHYINTAYVMYFWGLPFRRCTNNNKRWEGRSGIELFYICGFPFCITAHFVRSVTLPKPYIFWNVYDFSAFWQMSGIETTTTLKSSTVTPPPKTQPQTNKQNKTKKPNKKRHHQKFCIYNSCVLKYS